MSLKKAGLLPIQMEIPSIPGYTLYQAHVFGIYDGYGLNYAACGRGGFDFYPPCVLKIPKTAPKA